MFVVSMKTSGKRLLIIGGCLVAAIVLLATTLCFPAAQQTAAAIGDTDEDCAAYLLSLGYDVTLPAEAVREVQIPDAFDEALAAYNEQQKQAGFDLAPYAGQRVKYRTYTLKDAADTVHLYLYDGRLIGGDVTDGSGVVRPLTPVTRTTEQGDDA
ncbi:MAG: DUF4830 domain-containing protein [Clostridia bacterium]|nr:DUF4830 domain-containing protein [Clostridia bacterium]